MKYYIYQMDGMNNPAVFQVTSVKRENSPLAEFEAFSAEYITEQAIGYLSSTGVVLPAGSQVEVS